MTTNTSQPSATFASTQQMAEEVRQAAQNRTPDPIQAAAMECRRKMYAANENNMDGGLSETDIDAIIATAMRELVAREQLKDIHAVAAMREDLNDYQKELRSEFEAPLAKLREKVKNQADRIRVLEGPINHAGGLKHVQADVSLMEAIAREQATNARLRERVAELEKDNETLRRGARIAFDQEDHAEKCVESLETQLAAMTKERDDLLAENARIKMNHGCARNQGTTQFCAEVLAVQNERDELRKHADALAGALDDMGFSWVPSLEAYRASQKRPGI
jgi:chromosome segregation ATPase